MSINVNFLSAVAFTSFDENTFEYSVDGSKLTQNYVGEHLLIIITLRTINDEEYKIYQPLTVIAEFDAS